MLSTDDKMSAATELFAEPAVAPRNLTNAEVLDLRRRFYEDGAISFDEAAELFRIGERIDAAGPDWTEFFIEALTDTIVRQAEPSGYVSEDNADWLIAHIMRDGEVGSRCELQLLVHILECADHIPSQLRSFVLAVVADATLSGNGALLGDEHLIPGVIGKPEAKLIRRIIFAGASAGTTWVARAEADFLFDLNDATVDAANDSAWQNLFVQGITNHLMSAQIHQAAEPERALEIQRWMEDTSQSVGGFLGRMFSSIPRYRATSSYESAMADDNASDITALDAGAQVTGDEAAWLIDRITRDGHLHDNEIAVLVYLREHAPEMCESLDTLIGQI